MAALPRESSPSAARAIILLIGMIALLPSLLCHLPFRDASPASERIGSLSITQTSEQIFLVPRSPPFLEPMEAIVLFISVIGIWGVVKGHRAFIDGYILLLGAFVISEMTHVLVAFIDRRAWIARTLSDAWGRAYESDPVMIRILEMEFSCTGFSTPLDRSVILPDLPLSALTDLRTCQDVITDVFGTKLWRWGSSVMLIKFTQVIVMIGVLCAVFFYLSRGNTDGADLPTHNDIEKANQCPTYEEATGTEKEGEGEEEEKDVVSSI
ncbi:hypothetical protein BZG36_02394 [Bifiguratus adelaidae]|uniref:Uncharacterized protein n=1 Tax=Bifiguratus adelaidae TaxID=1938954 RepID=A0A261Y1B8_9FUNG|nr:hypothetical protein BZG36_02394 [Bifiguratus adelaidae]